MSWVQRAPDQGPAAMMREVKGRDWEGALWGWKRRCRGEEEVLGGARDRISPKRVIRPSVLRCACRVWQNWPGSLYHL